MEKLVRLVNHSFTLYCENEEEKDIYEITKLQRILQEIFKLRENVNVSADLQMKIDKLKSILSGAMVTTPSQELLLPKPEIKDHEPTVRKRLLSPIPTPSKKEYDNITAELLQRSGILKQNSIALQQLVERDREILKATDMLLAENMEKLKKKGEDVRMFSKRSWKTTWYIFMMMFVLMLIFLGMYLFIQIT